VVKAEPVGYHFDRSGKQGLKDPGSRLHRAHPEPQIEGKGFFLSKSFGTIFHLLLKD